MNNSNIRWIAREVRTRDYFRANEGPMEFEAYLIGSFAPGTTIVKAKDIHEELNDLLSGKSMRIKKVIFNPPATIVFWEDGTKTVVKIQNNETYDPEKGLAMAITKRALGNKGSYFNHIKKWVDQYYEDQNDIQEFEIVIPQSENVQKFIDDLRNSSAIAIDLNNVEIKRLR